MNRKHALASAAFIWAFALPGAALAQTAATATTDLNVRSGPGPEHPVIGAIAANGQVTISGCIEGSKWCSITHDGTQGWAYSDYLMVDMSGAPVVLTEGRTQVGVPVVTYDATAAEAGGAAGVTTGAVGGAVAGALIGGPVGAAIGGVAGAAAGGIGGAAVGAAVEVPDPALTYVTANPVDPVFLEGEVVVGAGVPDAVVLTPIPDYQYGYAYVNGVPVLVDPGSRQIVYVVR